MHPYFCAQLFTDERKTDYNIIGKYKCECFGGVE